MESNAAFFICRSAKNELTYQIKLPDSVTRIQNFITELFESVQHFLSHMSNTIGKTFELRIYSKVGYSTYVRD